MYYESAFEGKVKFIMKYIFLHGLGQTSSSWEKTIDVMDDNLDIDCPNLFTLLQGSQLF